ncbi:subtilisin-like protein, partial [Lactarius tabidus]
PHALELVTSWLDHHGVPSFFIAMTHGGGWLMSTDIPVSQANEPLGASYQLHRHSKTNDTTIFRTVSYGLPAMLHKHVETVVPTTCFASARTLWQTPRRRSVEARQSATSSDSGTVPTTNSEGSGRDQMDLPASLRWLYNYVPIPDQNTLGVASSLKEYPSQADLRMYMNNREDAMAANATTVRIGYDSSHPDPDAEANIEIEYTEATAYPTPHMYYSTGGLISNEPGVGDVFLDWLNDILSQMTIPQTISVSYGLLETDLPAEYATTVYNLFAQLGAHGVSVLFSSGDNSVGAGDCKHGSGNIRFIPEFLATCPYVTSVCGTTSQLPEAAVSISGSGFWFHFPRHIYQNDAVRPFLQNLSDQCASLYKCSRCRGIAHSMLTFRGVPDVSAQALRYWFIFGDDTVPESGTSYAALVYCLDLLNDHLVSIDDPPLSFLNPCLYSNGLVGLNDITSGSNPGCSTDGFSAIAGWDPVTGLGAPNIVKLQRILDNRNLHTGHKPFDDKEKDR